jgi:hypothetical protein
MPAWSKGTHMGKIRCNAEEASNAMRHRFERFEAIERLIEDLRGKNRLKPWRIKQKA